MTTNRGASAPRSAMPRRRSSVLGSAQCISSTAITIACVRAAAIVQVVMAANWRRRNSSGGKRSARSAGNGISSSGASKGTFSATSSFTCARVFSRSARRCSAGTSAPPNRIAAPCGEWVQRRVLEKLRTGPFRPAMRNFIQPSVKFIEHSRLTHAWFADDHHQLAIALPRPLPTTHQNGNFFFPADERRELALPDAAARAASAHEFEQARSAQARL